MKRIQQRQFAKNKPQQKFVRAGWERYTTYLRKEHIAWLKQESQTRAIFLMEVLDEILKNYIKRNTP